MSLQARKRNHKTKSRTKTNRKASEPIAVSFGDLKIPQNSDVPPLFQLPTGDNI